MSRITADPLLAAAKTILWLLGGIILFCLVVVAIGFVAILTVQRTELVQAIADIAAPAAVYWLVVLAIALIAGMLATALKFIQHLLKIVATVDQGDPFIPENAKRLAQMGWLTIAIETIVLLLWAMEKIVSDYSPDDTGYATDLTLSGWLLALVLFILARVFRHGTDLRAEVEGTV